MFLLSALDRRPVGPVVRSLARAAEGRRGSRGAGGPCPNPARCLRRGPGAEEPLGLPRISPACRGARHKDVHPHRRLTWMGSDSRALHALQKLKTPPESKVTLAKPWRRADILCPVSAHAPRSPPRPAGTRRWGPVGPSRRPRLCH